MKITAIELINVSFAYESLIVLCDINLKIYQNEFISLLGPNGGGKTTLLKLILGLLTPTKGQILIYGKSIKHAKNKIAESQMVQKKHTGCMEQVGVIFV